MVKCCRPAKLSGEFGVKRELEGTPHKSVYTFMKLQVDPNLVMSPK